MGENIATVAGAIGVLALAYAIPMFLLKRRQYVRWSRATGTVVELLPSESVSQDGEVWHARVEFQTSSGKPVRFKTQIASNPPLAKKGGQVQVRYDPSAPEEALVDSFFHRHIVELFAFLAGMGGLIAFFALRK